MWSRNVAFLSRETSTNMVCLLEKLLVYKLTNLMKCSLAKPKKMSWKSQPHERPTKKNSINHNKLEDGKVTILTNK